MFSFVICTYNPDQQTFERVINSVRNQNLIQESYEIIVVDNNSDIPVNSFDFIKNDSAIICKTEKRQGLAFARINGIKTAKSKVIIFVDDDNILDQNYLTTLHGLWLNYPQVAIWGPGHIKVEYKDGSPQWIIKNYSSLFQQKSNLILQYGCVAGWPDYYPAGSGMAVSRSVLENYLTAFEAGKLNATGRKGKLLSSSEDSQIVWCAVKMGLAAGTAPLLQLTHVIPKNRVSRNYLCRLNFGISSSYKKAFSEMFPELKATFTKRTVLSKLNFLLKTIIKSKGNPVMFYRFYTIDNSWFKGLDAFYKLNQ